MYNVKKRKHHIKIGKIKFSGCDMVQFFFMAIIGTTGNLIKVFKGEEKWK